MAGEAEGPIIIGSEDEFSDSDDVVVTKIEIEVDSEDVIFLSETKPPPKLESESVPPADQEKTSVIINEIDQGEKQPSLNRSTSVTTETGRLSLDDTVTETNNDQVPAAEANVFCSVPGPLDLSSKHSGPNIGDHGNSGEVLNPNQVNKYGFQLGPCFNQVSTDKLNLSDSELIPVSTGTKNMVDADLLSLIAAGSALDSDSTVTKQHNAGQTASSDVVMTNLNNHNSDDKTEKNFLNSLLASVISSNTPSVCNEFNTGMQPLCKTHMKSSANPSTIPSSKEESKTCTNAAQYPSQTTSVITHSSMAGSPVMTHTSMAGSTSSFPVSSVTTGVTFAASPTVTSSSPGMSHSPSTNDPFTTSHLLLSSLDSQWSTNCHSRSVFHPFSTSCCSKASGQTGLQTCAHSCQTQTGLCDNTVSQSGSYAGGLPGGSMTSLRNNQLKRSFSMSDKQCMYNSLTLPLSMQTPHMKHSSSASNLTGAMASSSGSSVSDIKPTRLNFFPHRPSPWFSDSAIPLPPKKQKRCYSQESARKQRCTNCNALLVEEEFSKCPNGHSTCSKCLKERVKLVLSGKEKESIKCLNRQCDSFYPMNELKLTLSPFVVEILEEKLDTEMIADMILKNNEETNDETEEDFEMQRESLSSIETAIKTEKFLKKYEDMPEHWDPMEERIVSKNSYQLVRLEPGSLEFEGIVAKFFESMTDSNIEVVNVHRVQNPIQWKYYTVKKAEMTQDNDGFGCVEEQQLFHGTNSSVVEAICRKGFDWRLCGKHGTMYGQGSYFAVNASYSHQYTDLRQPKKMSVGSTMMSTNPFSMTLPTQPSLFYPPVNVNFGQFPPVMSQNSAFSALNLSSQSTPATPSIHPKSSNYVNQPGPSTSQNNQQHNTSSNLNGVFPPLANPTRNCHIIPRTSQQTSAGNKNCNASTSQSGKQTVPHRISKFRVMPKPANIRQVSGLASAHITAKSAMTESPRLTAKMFIAKVLVGKYVGGESKYRKPPPLEPKLDPFGKCYDSCVDDIRSPKIFVIFDSAQAYPEYLLEYSYT